MSQSAALQQARQLCVLRRPSEALAILMPLLAANPADGAVRAAYATALLDCGQVEAARDAARAAAALEPHDIEVLCGAICVLRRTGPADEAARLAAQALYLAPTSTRVMFEAAMARSDAGDHRGALLLSAELVQAAPTWAAAHNARALVLRHDKRARSAEASIRQAIRLDPESSDLRNNLAIIQLSEGKVGAAARTLGDTLAADPRNQTANSNIVVLVSAILMWLYTAALLCAVAQTVVSLVPAALPVALALYALAAIVGWRWWRGMPVGIRKAVRTYAREHPIKRRSVWIALACLVLGLLAMLARTLVPILVAWGVLYGFLASRFWIQVCYQRRR